MQGVGANLQDHPVINGRIPLLRAQDPRARHANALCRFSSDPADDMRFNDLYFVSVEQGNDPRAARATGGEGEGEVVMPTPYGFIDVMLLAVESAGTVEITSTDPTAS